MTVDYATADGTATAGSDYTSTSGTLTFDAGTTSQTISVSIADDKTDESDETFTLTLSNASGADLGTSTATGTITNRAVVVETTPTLSIAGGNGKEGDDSSISFTVTLDESASETVTVDYATSDGTADSGDDYTAKSGTLSFSAGTTSKTISVSIADDVENESDETFTVTLSNASGADLGTSTATGTIRNRRVEPLTASFSGMPSEHDGSSFTFELEFSENVEAGFRKIRDRAFTLDEADITLAKRKNPQSADKNKAWTITVEPDGNDTISLTLPATTNCSSNRGICTADERKLSHSTSATVQGPVGISVGDVEVEEGAGVVLAFQVALTRAASSALTVDYSTSDGTATAGADYTSTSGTLTIGAGSSSGTVEVSVIDDEHNEGSEPFTLTLSNASSGTLTDASATGTITNHDALPKALVARFGRTAAVHIVDQVEERVNAPRAPGFDGRVAGRQINREMGRDFALDFVQQLGGGAGRHGQAPRGAMTAAGANGPRLGNGATTSSLGPQNTLDGGMNPGRMQGLHPAQAYDGGMGMGLGGDRLLGGSSFALNRATSGGGVLSFWSRSAQSSFYGQDGALALNGDMRSTMFGADYSKGRMITGVSLSHSRGLGNYAGVDTGRLTSAVTGLYPWIGYKASERVTVWTVAGYGAGGLMLSPGRWSTDRDGSVDGDRGRPRPDPRRRRRLRARVQGRRAVGRDADEGGYGARRKPRLHERRGEPAADRDRRVAEHDDRQPHGPDTQRRDRDSPGWRRRRNRAGHGPGRWGGAGRRRHRPGRGHPRAQAARASSRGIRRERRVDLDQLQPDTVDPARLHRARLPRLGRRVEERRRSALGAREHGRHGPGPAARRGRKPPRYRGRLRAADRCAVRRNATSRTADLGVRARLPGRLRNAGTRAGAAEPAARDRR